MNTKIIVTKKLGGIIGVVALIAILPSLGFICGAVSGLVVGWLFPNSIAYLQDTIGFNGAAWQLGGVFGFVGGFFKK